MSANDTASYAPKSPDLSSFYSAPPTQPAPQSHHHLQSPLQPRADFLYDSASHHYGDALAQHQHQHQHQHHIQQDRQSQQFFPQPQHHQPQIPQPQLHPQPQHPAYYSPTGQAPRQQQLFSPPPAAAAAPAAVADHCFSHSPPQQQFGYEAPAAHYQHSPYTASPAGQPTPYPAAGASYPPTYAIDQRPLSSRPHDFFPELQQGLGQHYPQQQPPLHIKAEVPGPEPEMPPRRTASPALPPVEPSPVRTKFPTARIKRIMQADEEVGKVAQQTPIAVGKALEMFMIQLVRKSADVAKEKGSKRVTAPMLKQVVETDEQWDFLRDIVSRVENEKDGGKSRLKAESESEEEPPETKKKGRGGRRKKT